MAERVRSVVAQIAPVRLGLSLGLSCGGIGRAEDLKCFQERGKVDLELGESTVFVVGQIQRVRGEEFLVQESNT